MGFLSKKKVASTKKDKLKKTLNTFLWNKTLMSTLGLWPANFSEFLFALNYGYFMFHMVLEYIDLAFSVYSLEQLLLNLTENMAFSQIVMRMLMLRVYNKELGEVIAYALKDFDERDYNEEEAEIFASYHRKSRIFMTLLTTNTALTASSYYLKPILGQMDVIMNPGGNGTFAYLLPYRFHTFYPVNTMNSYLWTYGSQLPFVFVSGLGQSAADCLMVTLVYHVSGQLAVLARRIERLDANAETCGEDFEKIVKRHAKLLEMGSTVGDAFSLTLLAHLIGATALVCILGFQILQCIAMGETAILGSFFAFIFLVLLVLFAHCTVGETLITECHRVCEAYYNCDWYKMSKDQQKLIGFSILRSQEPVILRAGKFSIFYLATFTDVIKTAMGYLSVLRTVML